MESITAPRLLPRRSPEGKPCFLTSSGDGYVSRLADEMEAVQLAMGENVLDHARTVLEDPNASDAELRYTGHRLAECLKDALRVAESRGMRLSVSDDEGVTEASQ
ncbi:hypothetical protein GL263_18380 [Streptomyces durbertensis]|uniref:Uncharacterized protein n=1 Tax=Streptomyces durbertensis TaxID=2448886 RepID=A0ABR6EJJ2_9ACTN|nr:hypothetical protein [Streptomyces durbertensis]MBB1245511.1 hypothetical protein [Streptomyces durbertensis]